MDAYKIALDFSKKLIEKFNGLVRIVALFGSYAKNKETAKSDIDILIVVDDIYNIWNDVSRAYYYSTLSEILKEEEFSRIHANTITLSVFWEMLKQGDPLIINILRAGIPILDSWGLFAAAQKMLKEGKIYPSKEAILVIKSRIPMHINMYKYYIAKSLEMVYWIFVDSAHYALMSNGYLPPSPEEVPEYLEDLRKKKKFDKRYIKWYKAIYSLVHKLAHREISDVSGETVEEWYQRAIDFKKVMEKLANS